MKRVLIVTNTASMIKLFNMRNIKILQQLGYEVFVATNFSTPGTISFDVNDELKQQLREMRIPFFNVEFGRKLGNPVKNYRSFKKLSKIVEQYHIDAIHTHAPLSSVISRIVAHKENIKCIYTSHGFQFFPGGPLRNWLFFYPVEYYLAKFTDAIITINQDDYHLVNSFPINHKYYIPGVGTDIFKMKQYREKRGKEVRDQIRKSLGIRTTDFMILSVGELSKRKNHLTVLKAIAKLRNPQIKYVIAGIGPEKERLRREAKRLGIANQLKLLGFKNNVKELYLAADLNAFLSLREGLGMGGLEGVALGLYTIGSKKTGIKDYLSDCNMGILIDNPKNVNEVSSIINKIIQNHIIAKTNYHFLSRFDVSNIDKLMKTIYQKELK